MNGNERMRNIGALFRESRSRTIILITGVLVVVGVAIGIWRFDQRVVGPAENAAVTAAPQNIQSVPGGFDVSQQYASLLKQANVKAAKEAEKTGESAIPTIIRSEKLGPGEGTGGKVAGGVGFKELRQSQSNEQPDWWQSVTNAKCDLASAKKALSEGASAAQLRKAGCSACVLRAAGLTAKQLLAAGFTPSELQGGGYDKSAIRQAQGLPDGYTAAEIRNAGCSVAALKAERAAGVSATQIMRLAGCSAQALRAAGFTPDEIAAAKKATEKTRSGYSMAALRAGGCNVNALKRARAAGVSAKTIHDVLGCSASALRAAGYTAKELVDAGYTPAQLRAAGFSAEQLKQAGLTAKQLAEAGFTPEGLAAAGFTPSELQEAGVTTKPVPTIPTAVTDSVPSVSEIPQTPTADQTLARIRKQQEAFASAQQRRQMMQQTQSAMQAQANQLFNAWRIPGQSYVGGTQTPGQAEQAGGVAGDNLAGQVGGSRPIIKAGSILFAVLDTAVNSDEPGPVLATLVGGNYKGATLIGTLQRQEGKVQLSFNRLSYQGFEKSISVNAVAIDPDTARTAISSHTDYHYLMRYGSLFASAFLQGYGQAVTRSGTTITSTPGSTTTVTEDLNPSEEIAAGLGQVGQNWSSQLAPVFNTPPTVFVNSGTGLGILFLGDVKAPGTVVATAVTSKSKDVGQQGKAK